MCKGLTDISSLGGHHALCIVYCSDTLKGYEILRTVKNIQLSLCDISDLSVLSHAKSVSLCGCHDVKDVSPLANVKSVALSSCNQIRDISLASVHSLSIELLPSLIIYNGIDRVKCLSAHYSQNAQTPVLPTAHNLGLCRCHFTSTFIKRFINLKQLKISFVESELIIVGCEAIPEVVIESCGDLQSIAGLGRNRMVRIVDCNSEGLDVSSLSNVPIVTIIYCEKIKDLSCLKNVPRLTVK